MNPLVEKHLNRLNILINYVQKNDKGEGLVLKRKDVCNILGISEGDSAKAIFKLLNEHPEEYSDRISVDKSGDIPKYFYVGDIKEEENQDIDTLTLSLKNAICIGSNRFISAMSALEISNTWNNQVVTYNAEIQRGEREVVDKDGNITTEPIYSKANVHVIAGKIADGVYHTDTIVLNVLRTGKEKIVFENGEVNFYNAIINILDGQHRSHSINEVRDLIDEGTAKIDLNNIIFPVQMENLTVEEAQDAFNQFSKGLKISSTRSEFFNNRDQENILLKEVMKDSILKNKVETVKNSIDKKEKENVVTFATLLNGFKMAFGDISDKAEFNQITKFLKEYFNELFSSVPELTDFERRIESKKESLTAENFAFYGYMSLANHLMDKPNWKEILVYVQDIDMNKDSSLWLSKVTRKGKKGYSITNNNDTRNYFAGRFVKEFVKITSK